MTVYSSFSHWKLCFSIVMLNYKRVLIRNHPAHKWSLLRVSREIIPLITNYSGPTVCQQPYRDGRLSAHSVGCEPPVVADLFSDAERANFENLQKIQRHSGRSEASLSLFHFYGIYLQMVRINVWYISCMYVYVYVYIMYIYI